MAIYSVLTINRTLNTSTRQPQPAKPGRQSGRRVPQKNKTKRRDHLQKQGNSNAHHIQGTSSVSAGNLIDPEASRAAYPQQEHSSEPAHRRRSAIMRCCYHLYCAIIDHYWRNNDDALRIQYEIALVTMSKSDRVMDRGYVNLSRHIHTLVLLIGCIYRKLLLL